MNMDMKQQEKLETEEEPSEEENDMDMDTEQQEELETEKKPPEAERNRLLEIYKLHAQLTSDSSNRLATTNRFYPAVMSGLLIIYFTFLQRKGVIFPDVSIENWVIGISTIMIGVLGVLFSGMWLYSFELHLEAISQKYEILKKLEDEFEFQFFRQEWELLGKKKKKVSYEQLFQFELYIPRVFLLIFIFLFIYGGLLLLTPASWVLIILFHAPYLAPFI